MRRGLNWENMKQACLELSISNLTAQHPDYRWHRVQPYIPNSRYGYATTADNKSTKKNNGPGTSVS